MVVFWVVASIGMYLGYILSNRFLQRLNLKGFTPLPHSIPVLAPCTMPIKFPISGDFGYSECSDEGLTLLMDATNSFDFSSQDLSSSCPSTSGSFSSTSSLYEPFTPTSRTSTPQHINYDGSFGDDSSMMDFTPPNSATSGYFPLDLKATVEPNMLINHGMPATPQRCNTIFDNSMSSHCSLDFTPGREMGLYPLDDGLYPSPCLDIQSSLPTQFDTNTPNFDFTSIWGQHGDSSPITFDSPSMHLMTPNSSPYDHNRRNVAMNGPQLSSTRLQQQTQPTIFDDDFMTDELAGQQDAAFHSSYMESLVQQTPSKSRPSKPRTATARPGARSQISGRVSKNGHDSKKGKMKCGTQKEKRPAFFCGLDQCEKRYMRAEHLKRHQEG